MIGRAQPPASIAQYVSDPTLCGYTAREVLDLEMEHRELFRQRQQLRARGKALEAALREIAEEPTPKSLAVARRIAASALVEMEEAA